MNRLAIAVLGLAISPAVTSGAAAGPEAGRIDYLSFAQGAVPLRVGGTAATLGASFEQAMLAVDGDARGYTLTLKPGDSGTTAEFVYELPAPTSFDRFAVPNVLETPSPSATFVRRVEVHGASSGPDGDYVLLAAGDLATHASRGQVTELTLHADTAVRWVKLRLAGGIQITQPLTFLEFSEIIGNGTQAPTALAERFTGVWRGRGVKIELTQDGPIVAGCFDTDGELKGTVSGNILHAVGAAQDQRIASAFVLGVSESGILRGVRSTNGGPFAMYVGEPAPPGAAPRCPALQPALGCGSVIHGIHFDVDSAVIRPDSAPVLERLFAGLGGDGAAVAVEGHTSSEGTETYNQQLSERRAQAVVSDLVRRGIKPARLSASGLGESRPLASNDSESGRSLNRRVEIHCR